MDGFQIARDMLSRDYVPKRQPLRGLSWESHIANAATLDVFEDPADLVPERPEWHAEAACKGAPSGLFFSERGENAKVKQAKAICAGCDVREACLDFAIASGEAFGVWGGLSENERRRIRGARFRAARGLA